MAKVTSKLQVTLPKAIAEKHGIRPGADIEWLSSGDSIHVVPSSARRASMDVAARLRLYDQATARVRARRRSLGAITKNEKDRGWSRDELYQRGRPG